MFFMLKFIDLLPVRTHWTWVLHGCESQNAIPKKMDSKLTRLTSPEMKYLMTFLKLRFLNKKMSSILIQYGLSYLLKLSFLEYVRPLYSFKNLSFCVC
jgi:hypothetical protein